MKITSIPLPLWPIQVRESIFARCYFEDIVKDFVDFCLPEVGCREGDTEKSLSKVFKRVFLLYKTNVFSSMVSL